MLLLKKIILLKKTIKKKNNLTKFTNKDYTKKQK